MRFGIMIIDGDQLRLSITTEKYTQFKPFEKISDSYMILRKL